MYKLLYPYYNLRLRFIMSSFDLLSPYIKLLSRMYDLKCVVCKNKIRHNYYHLLFFLIRLSIENLENTTCMFHRIIMLIIIKLVSLYCQEYLNCTSYTKHSVKPARCFNSFQKSFNSFLMKYLLLLKTTTCY